jgi:hypothetical protein
MAQLKERFSFAVISATTWLTEAKFIVPGLWVKLSDLQFTDWNTEEICRLALWINQCSGSVTFWYESRSADPYL